MVATLGDVHAPLLLHAMAGFAMHRDSQMAASAITRLKHAAMSGPIMGFGDIRLADDWLSDVVVVRIGANATHDAVFAELGDLHELADPFGSDPRQG